MAAPSHAPICLTILAALVALLPACSRKLDIDIFIVTKAGESVKLGLVEVSAIPIDAAEKVLSPIITKREIEYKKYETAQTKLTQIRFTAKEALRDFKHAAKEAHMSGTYGNFSGYLSTLDDIKPDFARPQSLSIVTDILNTVKDRETVTQSGERLMAAGTQVNAILTEHLRIQEEAERSGFKKSLEPELPDQDAEGLFAALPYSALSAKTNADGHCSLSLPSGDWLLAAKASRQLPNGKSEHYVWIRKAPYDGYYMLSNDNILRPGQSPFRE